jgi:poly-gamma-glutamate synthesis protein (capsule biosynthesis protein)
VNILRADSDSDLALAAADVEKARQSADLVVVSLHWGDEYRAIPTAWQRRVAAELIEAGADIILGHHPHVLQPIESHVARNGRQGLIAFSLGNFISSQNYGVANKNRTHRKALRGDGIILRIYAVKEQGKTSVAHAEFVPLWTLRDRSGKTVVYRPVNLAREIARLEALEKRTKEDEDTLGLLKFRMKVIVEQLTVKPVS